MKWFLSSTNTGDLSLTIKGLLVLVAPLFVSYLQNRGILVSESAIIDNGMAVFEAILTSVSGIMIIYGLIRKFINYYKSLPE